MGECVMSDVVSVCDMSEQVCDCVCVSVWGVVCE